LVAVAVITPAVPFLSSTGGETDLTPSVFLMAFCSFVRRGSVAGFSASFFCWSSFCCLLFVLASPKRLED